MTRKHIVGMTGLAVSLAALTGWAAPTDPQTSHQQPTNLFTYEGQLIRFGQPVEDECEFRFTFRDGEGEGRLLAAPVVSTPTFVKAGRVSVAVDLAAGLLDAGWLQAEVMCADDADFVPVSIRETLAPAVPAVVEMGSPQDETIADNKNDARSKSRAPDSDDVEPLADDYILVPDQGRHLLFDAACTGANCQNHQGAGNTAGGSHASCHGGFTNAASGITSCVCGQNNTAAGQASTVPGGFQNSAAGTLSFASGRQAKALHSGAFVWADNSVAADFMSTGVNQFLLRATGGVGIGMNAPTHQLTVQTGTALTPNRALRVIGTGPFGSLARFNFGDANFVFLDEDVDDSLTIQSTGRTALTGGFVGIGTTTPDNRLDVNGKISVTASAADEMVIINDNVWTHSSGVQDFGVGGDHFIVASREGSVESAGIFGDGNAMTLWSPEDGVAGQPAASLYVLDEDFFNADGNPYDDGALIAFLNTAGVWVASDINRKQNIASIGHAGDKIKRISGYTYEYKRSPADIEKGQQPMRSSGLIAQEVKEVLPEAVTTNADGEHFLNYAAVVPLLVESIKDQIDANQRMAAQINEQIDANRRMAAQIADLTARLERLED